MRGCIGAGGWGDSKGWGGFELGRAGACDGGGRFPEGDKSG